MTVKDVLTGIVGACGVLAAVVLSAYVEGATMASEEKRKNDSTDGYGKVIKSIVDSDIDEYYKRRLIETIGKEETPACYDGIVAIVTSNMTNYSKLDSVNKLLAKS